MDELFEKSALPIFKQMTFTYVHAVLLFLNYACNTSTFDNVGLGLFADLVKAYYNSSQKRRWTES